MKQTYHIMYESEGQRLVYATVQRKIKCRFVAKVYIHPTPTALEDVQLEGMEAALLLEGNWRGCFDVLTADHATKVAVAKKSMSCRGNFPLTINIGPKVPPSNSINLTTFLFRWTSSSWGWSSLLQTRCTDRARGIARD
jgi:hypothetical protein